MAGQGINRRAFLRGAIVSLASAYAIAPANARRRRFGNSNSDYYRPTGVGIWRPRRRQGWGIPALLAVVAAGGAFVFAAMRFRWLRELVEGSFSFKREWRALTRKPATKRPEPPRSWRLRG